MIILLIRLEGRREDNVEVGELDDGVPGMLDKRLVRRVLNTLWYAVANRLFKLKTSCSEMEVEIEKLELL